MKWKLDRVDVYGKRNASPWWKIQRFDYFSGNQAQFIWYRFAFVFVRKKWAVDA